MGYPKWVSEPKAYKRLSFNAGEIPKGLQQEHRLKAGVWGQLKVVSGELVFVDATGRRALRAGQVHQIEPESPHWLEEASEASIEIAFFREPPPA